MNIIIPMAGEGRRFRGIGDKPFIPVTNLRLGIKIPMVASAISDLPRTPEDKLILIGRGPEKKIAQFSTYLAYDKYIEIEKVTQGQAESCLLAMENISGEESLLISNCDHGMSFDQESWQKLILSSDVVVYTFKNHDEALRRPESYGWVLLDRMNNPIDVLVKEKPSVDHGQEAQVIIGTFWFKKARYFYEYVQIMMKNNDRRNNEFYVDQVMKYILQSGLKFKVFEVDQFHCWGTPLELEQYEKTVSYWRDFFARRS
jgi:bifunctional N-acetylglucosamine-1-phosphate-uridyltransferase/glucosamine-1-phosphate-acetyltransferase GlmU-like protein